MDNLKIEVKNEKQYREDYFNYNSTLPETETAYIKLITELESKLREIDNEIQNVKTNLSDINEYSSLDKVVKKTYSYIDRLHDYLDLIVKNPNDRLIEDYLPYSKMTEEIDLAITSQNLSNIIPFGMNKNNAIQYLDIDINIRDQILYVKFSLPLIDIPTRRGHVYEIIPIPIRTKNGTFLIKTESPYGIISDMFTPLQANELKNCKIVPNLNICSPYKKKSLCEWKIYKNAPIEEIFDNCQVERLVDQNYVTPLGHQSIHLHIDSFVRVIEYCRRRFRRHYANIKEEHSFTTDGILKIELNCALTSEEFELNNVFSNKPTHALDKIYDERHNRNLKERLNNPVDKQTHDEQYYEESKDISPIAIKKSEFQFELIHWLYIFLLALILYGSIRCFKCCSAIRQ